METLKHVFVVGATIAQAREFLACACLFNRKGFGVEAKSAENFSILFKAIEIKRPRFIFFHDDAHTRNPEAFETANEAIASLFPSARTFIFKTGEELRVFVLREIDTPEASNGTAK